MMGGGGRRAAMGGGGELGGKDGLKAGERGEGGGMGDGTLQILYLIGANPTQASHHKRVGSIAYTIKV